MSTDMKDFIKKETNQCAISVVRHSYIRPIMKCCSICIYYDRDTYPNNKDCKECGAPLEGRDLEHWRMYVD